MTLMRFVAVCLVVCALLYVVAFARLAHGATGPACVRTAATVVVDLNDTVHARIIDHALDARRHGQPVVLHIARSLAAAHRRASLRGIPTRKGFDRDEYPPAMSLEGGKGADVRYVKSAENRSAGSVMRLELAAFCDGQRFAVESLP